jgi:hypothetical protein
LAICLTGFRQSAADQFMRVMGGSLARHIVSDNTGANLLTPPQGIGLVSKADT